MNKEKRERRDSLGQPEKISKTKIGKEMGPENIHIFG
jgi:hypothetical protein